MSEPTIPPALTREWWEQIEQELESARESAEDGGADEAVRRRLAALVVYILVLLCQNVPPFSLPALACQRRLGRLPFWSERWGEGRAC